MPIDPNVLKKVLVTIFVIAGLFIGYQFIAVDKTVDVVEDQAPATEQGYSDEDIANFKDTQSENIIIDEQMGKRIQFDNSYEHTKPGEYSEIIVNASGFEPDEFTIMYVRFAGTQDYIEAGGQEQVADADGNMSTRFTITQFGTYEVLVSSKGEEFVSQTIVVE